VNGELVNAGMPPSMRIKSSGLVPVVWACSNSMGMLPAPAKAEVAGIGCRVSDWEVQAFHLLIPVL